jgi:hypothetical protein
MITDKGTLVKYKTDGTILAEVLGTWNKRDIDPDCPESVAIIGMVKFVYASGPELGKERSIKTRNFTHFWEAINDA